MPKFVFYQLDKLMITIEKHIYCDRVLLAPFFNSSVFSTMRVCHLILTDFHWQCYISLYRHI